MSIPIPQSGLRTETPYNLVLDAGVVYKNINMTMLRNGLSTAYTDAISSSNTWTDPNGVTVTPTKLGATKGGTAVDCGKKERPVEFDSRRTNVKGLTRTDDIMPTLKTRLLEVGDYNTLAYILGSQTTTDWTTYKELVPTLVISDSDYLGNIAIVAPVAGSSLPMVVVLENAKVINPQAFDMKDKDELAVEVTFTGHSLASNQYNIPIHFFVPATTSGSADTTAPTLTDVRLMTTGGTVLVNNDTGISVTSDFVFNYSEGLDSAYVTPTQFTITNATTGAVVAAAVTQTTAGVVTVNPSASLGATTVYIISDSTQVRDVAGNMKAARETRRFTTA